MKKRDKKQLLPGIVVAVAISFLVFLYAPVDLYCSNISELRFDFRNSDQGIIGPVFDQHRCAASDLYCLVADPSGAVPSWTGRRILQG